jgi:hypothetical protein
LGTDTVETILDVNTARAILSEVANGGWLDQDVPEDEKDLVDLASYYVNEAKKWVEDGNPTDESINAIINLAKISPPVLSETVENTNDEVPPGESNLSGHDYGTYIGSEDYERDKKIRQSYPRRSSGGFSEQDIKEYDGLPVPSPLPEAPLEMPTDLTDVGDKRVRTLYSAFTSYWGRARWNLGVATNNLTNATHLRDEAYRSEYIKIQRRAAVSGEKLTQGALENLAKNTEEYKEWNQRVTDHEQEVVRWRTLTDIYGKNVEVLSRDWTMRTEQYERER